MNPRIVLSIVTVAATATLMDWIWYTFGVGHSFMAGLVHGAVLLTVVGGGLGAVSGRLLKGLPVGALAGVGGAVAYYIFIAVLDDRPYGTAIPASWVVMWLLIAVMEGRLLSSPVRRSWTEIAVRGVSAAVLSGVSFYLVMNTLWGAPPETGRNYMVQLGAWAVAWAPGLLALSVGRLRHAMPRHSTDH